jgi:hypothetical protein
MFKKRPFLNILTVGRRERPVWASGSISENEVELLVDEFECQLGSPVALDHALGDSGDCGRDEFGDELDSIH